MMAAFLSYRTFLSYRSFEKYLSDYEEETMTKFTVLTKDRSFGQDDPKAGLKKITWELKYVPFNGTPFEVVGRKIYSCHQGIDKHKKEKQARQQKLLDDQADHNYRETRRLVQDTKKLDCPAKVNVFHIIRFLDYKVFTEVQQNLRESAVRLRHTLQTDPSAVHFEEQYVACFPNVEEHENHPVVGQVTEVREPVDPGVESSAPSDVVTPSNTTSPFPCDVVTATSNTTSSAPSDVVTPSNTTSPFPCDVVTATSNTTSSAPSDVVTPSNTTSPFPCDVVTATSNTTSSAPSDNDASRSGSSHVTSSAWKAKKRRKCGRLLHEITDLSYHLQDEPFLDSVIGRLTDLLEDVRLHTPHDETLPLSYTPPRQSNLLK
ncbi:uncharacterized protein LOC143122207 [Alosa pseudoharengus]|uniref:uncharacterized protein LOC143122207 n=1 Tax=Alosa pseudoharengus TaxID=34774 RepID=UPI003F8A8928